MIGRATRSSRLLNKSGVLEPLRWRRTLSTSFTRSNRTDTLPTYLLLSRPPTILPAPTPFESAYYAYNRKLHRALSQPFDRDLYFKKGSAAETQFIKDEAERTKRMKDGEAPVTVTAVQGADTSELETESANEGSEGNMYKSLSRTTEADVNGDITSIERNLDRTLFLVVKGGQAGKEWTIPMKDVTKSGPESLHKEAPEALYELLGRDMDIWMITNWPVGVIQPHNDAKNVSV